MIKSTIVKIAFLYIISLSIVFSTYAQIGFSLGSSYKYLKGNAAENLDANWMSTTFDDSAWSQSNAPFRYGDGQGGTELSDMQGNYSTLFLRSTFSAIDVESLGDIEVAVDWDDGFALFINGQLVLNNNAPNNLTYNALATGQHEYGESQVFTLPIADLGLQEGENTIAVFACNITLGESSDFYFDMSMNASIELPEFQDLVGLNFSHNSGFYNDAFVVDIEASESDVSIVYTIDGSNPQTSFTSITTGSVANITIDPSSTQNRAQTPAVVLRVSVTKEGFTPSKPIARTFIFLDQVYTQTNPGGDWPNSNVNGQHIDYDMDPNVTQNSTYADDMEEAMLQIPSISITTDNKNLFNRATGIYVNADEQGSDWERECSVELISDKFEGFNVNAGLRIRGGWSRHPEYPKHAFRLFFREEYGFPKLYFPLFEDEGAAEFDKVDLRCAQNYSWANSSGQHNTFVREVFLRDSQGKTGHPYTRSRYYHLYLNGMYWGIFQTQERSEARYAETYFGGDHEDYDVIKISGKDYSKDIVATDGTTDKWEEIYDMTEVGFSSNENYFFLEGKDAEGNPIKGGEIFVDIDNLIDYMINIFYSGNYDAPVSAWGGNKNPNNMYAITNRERKSQGFVFFVHDGEHTLMAESSSGPGIGLYENRANIGKRSGDDRMEVYEFKKFHIQWLHEKLSDNAEYRQRFADRAWRQLNGNGIFTPDACLDRFNSRASQIDMAIIGESARWGDTQNEEAFTKNNAWIPELDVVRFDYFPYRTEIVIDQLEDVELYNATAPPIIEEAGSEVLDLVYNISGATSISIYTYNEGTVYYTTNGKDPRLINGGIANYAKITSSDNEIELNASAIIKARVYNNDEWSALNEVQFIAPQTDFTNFKVTELHYHPTDSIISTTDTIDGGDFEFIEFKNTGFESAINLSGVIIDSAIYYEFPKNSLLAPQEYFVVAAKPVKFYDRYGRIADGNFSKSLSNGGEQVLVHTSTGDAIMDFTYSDELPWSQRADGEGPSLVAVNSNPIGDPNIYSYWTSSSFDHGNPGTPDPNQIGVGVEPVVADFTSNFRIFPNPTSDELNIQSIGNSQSAYSVSLFDVNGKKIYTTQTGNQNSIALKSLNIDYGVYFSIIEQEGNELRQKVVYAP